MNTAVAEAQSFNRKDQLVAVQTMFNTRIRQIEEVLPGKKAAERFVRVVMTAVQNNPELLDCEPRSLFHQALRCATDGFIPDGKSAVLVIYKDRKRGVKTVSYQPMVYGITQAILKSPEIASIDTAVVYEGDEFAFELGDAPFIRHAPKLEAPAQRRVICAYSVATFKTGEKSREVMSYAEIEKTRAVSRAADSGPWVQWYGEMARKTVLKRHAKRLPMSNDAELAIARDNELSFPDDVLGDAKPLAPPSKAAADQDSLDDQPLSRGDGVKDDETDAQAITRFAHSLTAAAKDGALSLRDAWQSVPADLVEPLQGTYDALVAQMIEGKPT